LGRSGGFGSSGQVHGLGQEGDPESCAEVFGIEKRGREFRQGRGSLSSCQQNLFLEGVETDGEKEPGRQRDGTGDGEEQGRSFQE
jgi:hypothetical protein